MNTLTKFNGIRHICRVNLLHLKWFGKKCNNGIAIRDIIQSELDISEKKVDWIFEKITKVKQTSPQEILQSIKVLKSLPFTKDEIVDQAYLLTIDKYILENQYLILNECGFPNITAKNLRNYYRIMSQSAHFNKCYNFLPKNINIVESIVQKSSINLENITTIITYKERMPLKNIYSEIRKLYLKTKLNASDEDVEKVLKRCPSLKIRSLSNIEKTINMITNELEFPIERIKTSRLLQAQPNQLKKLIDTKELCGIDIRTILSNCVQITTTNFDNILQIQKYIELFDIPQYAVQNYKRIFSMLPENFKRNVQEINQMKESSTLLKHPEILKVTKQFGVLQKQWDSNRKENDSLKFTDVLSDYILNKSEQNNSMLLLYLSHVLKRDTTEIKKAISNHPQWKKVSFNTIFKSIEFLSSKKFTVDEIFEDIYIILYSRGQIKERLSLLNNPEELAKLSIDRSSLTNPQILRLCVYLIEKDCNFSGDGAFFDRNSVNLTDDEIIEMDKILKTHK